MIIFIYGSDTFRSRQKLQEIKNKFVKDVNLGITGLSVLDGEKLNLEKLNETSATSSLFSSKRMIIIENIFSNKNTTIFLQIFNYLKDKKTDNIFVFWDENNGDKISKNKLFTFLIKQPFVQNFKNLNNQELNKWIKNQVEKNGCSINGQVVSLIIAYFESNLWQINNELNKLINFTKKTSKTKIIDKTIFEKLARGKIDTNIFALTDAISSKNKKQALNLFQKELDAGTTDVYLLHMITRQIKILLELKDAQNKGLNVYKIKKDFKMHPFVIDKGLIQANKFEFKDLQNIFLNLIEIDKNIKTGKENAKTSLSLLIGKV